MNGRPSIRKKVVVVGARGYSGLELCRLLLAHPCAHLEAAIATDADWKLSDLLPEPNAASVRTVALADAPRAFQDCDAVFLATPAESSIELAPIALESGASCIDLSGAFRLKAAQYPQWYRFTHLMEALLERAYYGLSPFASVPQHATGKPVLISNPGCYATSVLMALIPLLRKDLIDPRSIVVDAKSGTSGAGKKASENLLFTEVDGECLPYRLAKHQHYPEIQRYLSLFSAHPSNASAPLDFHFTPHLLPTRRGILSSIYGRMRSPQASTSFKTAYEDAYGTYALVRHAEGESPLLSLKRVVGSARTHLSYAFDGDKFFLFSTLDNLLKGAASQAIENFNQLFGWDATLGLVDREGVL